MDTHTDQTRAPSPEPTSIEARLDETISHLSDVKEIADKDRFGSGLEYALPLYIAGLAHIRDAFKALHEGNTTHAFFYASAAFAAIEGSERYLATNQGIDCVAVFRECPLAMIQSQWANAEKLASEFTYRFTEMSFEDFRGLKRED